MNPKVILIFILVLVLDFCQAQTTAVMIPVNSIFGGMAYNKPMTITAANTLITDGQNLWAGTYTIVPASTTNPIVNLYPNTYLITVSGVVKAARFTVPASTNVLDITTLLISGPLFYFGKTNWANLIPGNNVSFITNADGSITFNSNGGIGVTNAATTNGLLPAIINGSTAIFPTNYDVGGSAAVVQSALTALQNRAVTNFSTNITINGSFGVDLDRGNTFGITNSNNSFFIHAFDFSNEIGLEDSSQNELIFSTIQIALLSSTAPVVLGTAGGNIQFQSFGSPFFLATNWGVGLSRFDFKGGLLTNFIGNGSGLTSLNGKSIAPVGASQSIYLGQLAGQSDSGQWANGNLGAGVNSLNAVTNGTGNTAIGYDTMAFTLSGSYNTALGYEPLYFNQYGQYNTAIGQQAMYNANDPTNDTAIGYQALRQVLTGTNDIAVGWQAGTALDGAESYDIDIGSFGVSGESGVTRIGTSGQQTQVYIAGQINGNGAGLTNQNASVTYLLAVPLNINLINGGTNIFCSTNASFNINFVPAPSGLSSAYLKITNSGASSITATVTGGFSLDSPGTTNALIIASHHGSIWYADSFGDGSTNLCNSAQ